MRTASTRATGARAGRRLAAVVGLLAGTIPTAAPAADDGPGPELAAFARRYCVACHGGVDAEARLDLRAMAEAPDFGRDFKDWERVVRVLRDRSMPPEEMPQPGDARREAVARSIIDGIDRYVERHAGDPGPVPIRRLTAAEYAYTVLDLTGLDLKLADDFVADAASGEGFTNAGGGQFMQDSTLERYLEAAKGVADHAVIGAGPLAFFADPGRTGRELSAVARIQRIYREHGFRTAAGEGAEPFGLDRYPRAMFVAWQVRHRDELGLGGVEPAELARRAGVSARLCAHVGAVLDREGWPFPLSEIAARWRALPAPGPRTAEEVRALCDELGAHLRGWQGTLGAAAGNAEEAGVLTAGAFALTRTRSLTSALRWAPGAEVAGVELSVSTASGRPAEGAVVLWRNARVRFRRKDLKREPPRPLAEFATPEAAARLRFGVHPRGGSIAAGDFATVGEGSFPVEFRVPEGMVGAQLLVDLELAADGGTPDIVRCRMRRGIAEGGTAAEVNDISTLLADPDNPDVDAWRRGVDEFARLLPEVSHREPTPSDRDPIPAPFDNTYNMPERNLFHTAIKYHRDDAFFVEHVADDATRRRLDQAWADLLTAFDYHDANLRFAAKKFALDLGDRSIADLEVEAIDRLPPEPRAFVRRLKDEHAAMHRALHDAEPGHVDDALGFAERAWRRPLSADEQGRLRAFYAALRGEGGLDHDRALRTLLARILLAPAFLYRAEPTPDDRPGVVPLDDWQLASRLSFFLWASTPDEELRAAAASGRLSDPEELARQARRMLRDPKARRLATEFFGQWLGFYRFDRHAGIDAGQFPEFTERLRSAMYEEAVAFFEHVVREDRPVDEILFADYTFLNRELAEHYGIPPGPRAGDAFERVDGLAGRHRGGLLGLGAVLTVTSAPLRTSAVKRGDWVLRRVVGTPVPPPPADVGSIPAEEALADGLTVRQRLEAHRSDASCVNCHARIDPLGFALEPFDPIGRWRDAYRDGRPIDPSGTLADGTTVSGPDGLRAYLRREKGSFHRTLGAKLLGYALGRPELVSDRPLIGRMVDDLGGGGRFSDLVVRIVTSEPFRNRRADPGAGGPAGDAAGGER